MLTFSDETELNLGKIKGEKGDKGDAGKDGASGADGKDGIGIANVSISDDGILIVSLTNGTALNLGNIKGADGIGITKSVINSDGHLVLTYSNGSEADLGNVVGEPGASGTDGKPGADGVGIKDVTISTDGVLIVTLSNHEVKTLGNIRGEKGEKGDPGKDGKDGRGIAKTELSNGELIITYTDGTQDNLGAISSPETADDTKYFNFTILDKNSVSVALKPEYIGTLEGKITIPGEYNGRKVTAITSGGFEKCWLSEIELPDTLLEINSRAFAECKNLTTIKLPDALLRIYREAFRSSALTSITIPKNVYYIDDCALWTSSLTSVKFENTVGWTRRGLHGGSHSAGANVSSATLADEAKAAALFQETYGYYDNGWKSATDVFSRDRNK